MFVQKVHDSKSSSVVNFICLQLLRTPHQAVLYKGVTENTTKTLGLSSKLLLQNIKTNCAIVGFGIVCAKAEHYNVNLNNPSTRFRMVSYLRYKYFKIRKPEARY